MVQSLSKVQFADKDLERFETLLKSWADQVSACPLLDSKISDEISFSAGVDKEFNHRLGRKPEGIINVYQLGTGTFYVVSWDKNTVKLHPSDTVTAKFLVF